MKPTQMIFFIVFFYEIVALTPSGADVAWERIDLLRIGLSAEDVTALHLDQNGHMWVGTWGGGIAELAGDSWIIHDLQLDRKMVGRVHRIVSDRQGTIWALEDEESIWRYSEGRWRRFSGSVGVSIAKPASEREGSECWNSDMFHVEHDGIYDGVPYIPGYLHDLAVDEQGDLWIASFSDKAIFRFDGQRISCWDDEALVGHAFFEVYLIAALPQGEVWGLGRDNSSNWAFAVYKEGQWTVNWDLPFYPWQLHLAGDGTLWSSDGHTLWSALDGHWEPFITIDSVLGTVHTIADDRRGGVWLAMTVRKGGMEGVAIVHTQDGRIRQYPYPHDHNFPGDVIPRLVVDSKDQVWFGDRAGLFVLKEGVTHIEQESWGNLKHSTRDK
jgi:streptogramin lyase